MGKHFDRGLTFFQLCRWREAVQEFTREISDHPQSDMALAHRAAALINLSRHHDAEENARQAISINPENAYAFYVLSFVFAYWHCGTDAMNAISEAIRIEPQSEYYCQSAVIHFDAKQFTQCVEATRHALTINPRNVSALILQARALARINELTESRALLLTALATNPESPEAHRLLGKSHLRTAQAPQALVHLLEARRIDPTRANDPNSIAAALGASLPPFRQIAPFLIRLEHWAYFPRWVMWIAFALTLIALDRFLRPTIANPSAVFALLFVIVANYLIMPLSFDLVTISWGRIFGRKHFIHRPQLTSELGNISTALFVHATVTGIALVTAYGHRGIFVVIVGGMLTFDSVATIVGPMRSNRPSVRMTAGLVNLSVLVTALVLDPDLGFGLTLIWLLTDVASLTSSYLK